MRKIFIVLIVLSLLLMSGCRSPDSKSKKPFVIFESQSSETVSAEKEDSEETVNRVPKTDTSKTAKKAEESTATVFIPKQAEKSKATESAKKNKTDNSPAVIIQSEQRCDNPTIPEPQEKEATADDADNIAKIISSAINEYRLEQGSCELILLPGLSEYAKYRSRQLISHFAHDSDYERIAATALKYGMYVDPALYGMTGGAYYTACASEAIAKAGYSGTAEKIAHAFASLTKSSAPHWSYIGNNEYKYVGVGLTYESGMWYCDIAVAKENSDEK